MRINLIDYTGKGTGDPWYAASLMIWTKRTRVEMSPGGLDEIIAWPEEKKVEELKYMAATVPSSWEFCDYTFLIQGVTRAFTHQLVRTRTLSYAQQAMQVLDVSQGPGWEALVGPTVQQDENRRNIYSRTLAVIADSYKLLVRDGTKVEDARGLLPTNILTNIVVKGNLRSFCDLIRKRVSPRNQGEFVDVLRFMKEEMLRVHPWTDLFINRTADVVAADLYNMIAQIEDKMLRTDINKGIDQLLTNIGQGN
jgi:flavin-dependent thymidylate synthase